MYHLHFHPLKTFSFEVHGSWSTWSMWDPCTKTCDRGKMTRRRYCDDPPPLYGGSACVGSSFYQDYQVKYSTFVCFISPFPQTDVRYLLFVAGFFELALLFDSGLFCLSFHWYIYFFEKNVERQKSLLWGH